MTLRRMLLPSSTGHVCPAVPPCRDGAVEARGPICKPWARTVSQAGISEVSTPDFCLHGCQGAGRGVLCHRALLFSCRSGTWDPSVTPSRSASSPCSCQRGWDDTSLSPLSFAILTLLNKTRAQIHLVMHVLFFFVPFLWSVPGAAPSGTALGSRGLAPAWWSCSLMMERQRDPGAPAKGLGLGKSWCCRERNSPRAPPPRGCPDGR